jgi:hypothetical protein
MRTPVSKLRLCLVWLMILACTGSACAASARALGAVLCVGADGHAVIEYATAGDCGDRPGAGAAHHAPAEQVVIATGGHCGDCLDVVLAEAAASAPRGPLVLAPADLDSATPVLAAAAVRAEIAAHTDWLRTRTHPWSFPRPLLRERRATVLRI